ncbi:MAG: 3TM-type holin [Gammaproteobacteria bacterium]
MLGIDNAVGAVATLADSAIKRIWPDATAVELAKLEQLSQEMQNEFLLVAGQLAINKSEAQHASVKVAGWRPYVGWVCGTSLLYVALIEPLLRFAATVLFGYQGMFPVIDTDLTMQILIGMLGLAGSRSFEKVNGVARERI